MEAFVTGTTIKKLREEKRITQGELAQMIGVSDKAVSKWETGRGLPDISLLEPLFPGAGHLGGGTVCRSARDQRQQTFQYQKDEVLRMPRMRQRHLFSRRNIRFLLRSQAPGAGGRSRR